MPKRLTQEEFITKAKLKHGDKYDYSKIKYTSVQHKVCIICPEHGEFWQRAGSHIVKGCGCELCGNVIKGKKLSLSKDNFLIRANKIHKNKYDYSKVEFKHSENKVSIICPEHGEFLQTVHGHLNGKGCSKCANENNGKRSRLTKEQFIINSKLKHGDKYDYSKVEYIDNRTKVIIICPVHGEFYQAPSSHASQGHGCPRCRESTGERDVRLYLINKQIKFKTEATFDNCKNPKTNRKLLFDFWLPDYNILIEIDGKQHSKSVSYWGGEEALVNIKYRDSIKNNFAKENNIMLYRIVVDKKLDVALLDEILK